MCIPYGMIVGTHKYISSDKTIRGSLKGDKEVTGNHGTYLTLRSWARRETVSPSITPYTKTGPGTSTI